MLFFDLVPSNYSSRSRGCCLNCKKCLVWIKPHQSDPSPCPILQAHHSAPQNHLQDRPRQAHLSNPKRQQHRISRVADVAEVLGRRHELEAGNGWAFYRLVEFTVGGLRPNPTLVQRAAKVGYEPRVINAAIRTKGS